MRSYILQNVSSLSEAIAFLRAALPGQERPWVLRCSDGDPIAYLDVAEALDGKPNLHISADVSGRHLDKESSVRALLVRAQQQCGGNISDAP